ncbi:MAG: SH3 domain-containing protein [Clostridia bacterium]|nr:SH3 domain-containing protein [Clostridia bacterium]
MKKKLFWLLLTVYFCLLPLCALAAGNCPDHPKATKTRVYTGSVKFSVVKHTDGFEYVCSVCGRDLGPAGYDWHRFSGDSCSVCGYQRPSREQLKGDAAVKAMDEEGTGDPYVTGRECWTLYSGAVYSGVGGGAQVTSYNEHTNFYITAYEWADASSVWLRVRKASGGAELGWIPASDAHIADKPVSKPTPAKCRIMTSSGRVRADAGQEYAYIETVHYGEVYTVLDAKEASNGVTWYKLRVGGREGWISSGLVDEIY